MMYKDLLEMYELGALKVTGVNNVDIATVGGVTVTKEQADEICKSIGWTDYVLSPFKIIDKTAKFMKTFSKEIDSSVTKEYMEIEFRNVAANDMSGRTFDRIHLTCAHPLKGFEVSIIYNMPRNTAKYVVYRTSNSFPLFKASGLAAIGEYINTLG